MSEIMDREELLCIFSTMIRQAFEDWEAFEDVESRRKFMNSIVSAGTQYNTIESRENLIALREELKQNREIMAEFKEWKKKQ